jgi:L-asparaginase/Glu-tRNA(Gln) amidotransferase subunit D
MKLAPLALAGYVFVALSGPVAAQDAGDVPFLGEAQDNYRVVFTTAMRLLDTQGSDAVKREVANCYANIEADERIRRTQYCFLYDIASVVTDEFMQAAIKGQTPDGIKGAVLNPKIDRAAANLFEAGFSRQDAARIVLAWLMTGKAGMTADQAREFGTMIRRKAMTSQSR